VDEKVGEAPSTLRLMLPEAYLDTKDTAEETEKINRTMKNYLENGVFKEVENSFVYVERDMTVGAKRQGLAASSTLRNTITASTQFRLFTQRRARWKAACQPASKFARAPASNCRILCVS
jgi:hypothetical protein